jgi:hypothetical protein
VAAATWDVYEHALHAESPRSRRPRRNAVAAAPPERGSAASTAPPPLRAAK